MSSNTDSWILGLAAAERLLAMALNVGARVRERIAAGEPVTDADLDVKDADVRAQIEAARVEIKAKQAAGDPGLPG